MSAVNKLLDRLDGLRETGCGRWVARCPAHNDRSPSLSVAEGDDGRALLYCHAGCSALEIVDALGLELRDLFDPPPGHRRPGRKPAPDWRGRLLMLELEARIVALTGRRIQAGETVSAADRKRFDSAVARIVQIAGGSL